MTKPVGNNPQPPRSQASEGPPRELVSNADRTKAMTKSFFVEDAPNRKAAEQSKQIADSFHQRKITLGLSQKTTQDSFKAANTTLENPHFKRTVLPHLKK